MGYEAINLSKKFTLFDEQWQPKVIAEMNDYQFKVVKLQGDFIWHDHKNTDETFIVLEGVLRIDFRDGASGCRRAKCSSFRKASSTNLMPNTRSS
jgi:mannose-6-phosphate isomerase-like protein (cupin superfamily)